MLVIFPGLPLQYEKLSSKTKTKIMKTKNNLSCILGIQTDKNLS